MTALVWDQITDRRYEAGVERGVLFPLSGPGVAWNGLVSVVETTTREVKSYWLDGMKFLDHVVPGSYNAKIQAYTYPYELEELIGIHEYAPGVNLHDQRSDMFGLSYRTRVGNVEEGLDHGYKVHLVYGLTAVQSDPTMSTVADQVAATVFEWSVTGAQTFMLGIRPTNHLSFDSLKTHPAVLAYVEDHIYGTDTTDPALPDLTDLLTTVQGMA